MNVFAFNVLDEGFLTNVFVICAFLSLVLFFFPFNTFRVKRILWCLIGLAVGLTVGYSLLWLTSDVLILFDGPVAPWLKVWVTLSFGAVGLALSRLRDLPGSWKVLSFGSALVYIVAGALGANAVYGLNPTIGSIFSISTADSISVSRINAAISQPIDTSVPVSLTWNPPSELPSKGTVGEVTPLIPSTISGFPARASQIYLPPAALVSEPPALPIVVMMMGQPGNPDASLVEESMNDFARSHKGLAPIVLVIDQLGNPYKDALCLDSSRGNVETYITKDVVPWILNNLKVINNRQYWTIAGFSNGGTCALYLGAKYPGIWGNIWDFSGEEFAGFGEKDRVLKEIFDGNQSGYDAIKPSNIMAKLNYSDSYAVFTMGDKDWHYSTAKNGVVKAATEASMRTSFHKLSGIGHTGDALTAGLPLALKDLEYRLGFSSK